MFQVFRKHPIVCGLVILLLTLIAIQQLATKVAFAAPANDNFENAQTLVGIGSLQASNVSATRQIGEPFHAGTSGGSSVWYRWTAFNSGQFYFHASVTTAPIDTLLAVYTGASVTSLTEIASNNDQNVFTTNSRVQFFAQTGVTYFIAVDGRAGGQGNFLLEYGVPPPANDNFANALTITQTNNRLASTFDGATSEFGEPGFGSGTTVWYRWTAMVSGNATFNSFGSTKDTILFVYTGNSVDALSEIAQNNDFSPGTLQSQVTFNAIAGTTYHFQLDVYSGDPSGGTCVLTFVPPNDNLANAQVTNGPSGMIIGSNIGATSEPGEVRPNLVGSSIWYRWQAPASFDRDMVVFRASLFNTTGGFLDSLLTVYSGPAAGATFSNLQQVAQVSRGPSFGITSDENDAHFPVVKDATYYIRIAGYQAEGATKLEWLTGRYSAIGRVVDINNRGVFGAVVTLSGSTSATVSTVGDGFYTFNNLGPWGVGSYTVRATFRGNSQRTASGADVQQVSQIAALGNVTLSDFIVTSPLVNLKGKIVDANNTSLGVTGVTVSLTGDETGSVTTDATGIYTFPSLVILGDYLLTLSRPGFNISPPNFPCDRCEGNELISHTAQQGVNLTVASSNPASGVSITVSPVDRNSQGNGATQFTRNYNNNTLVSLTAPPTASGNNFQKWQRDGVDFAVTQATSVTMDANHTMTAVYVAPARTLTVASTNPASGVSITVSPNDNGLQGNGATQFTRTYNNNTLITLTAPPTVSGNNFQKWQRDGVDFAVTQATSVTMDANHTMTAVYVTPARTLTVASTNPASGVGITVSPNDNATQGNGTTQFTRTYNNNTLVTLTAPPTVSGNNFQKWQRDGVDFAVTQATSVTMNADQTLTAVYVTPARTLTVASTNPNSGVNISVTPNDNGLQGNGTTQFTRSYNNNTVVSLTAPTSAGVNNFQKWLKDGVDFANNQLASVSVTMDANHIMTAVYVMPPFLLLLDQSGPAANQIAALESLMFLRDPFPVVRPAYSLNNGTDRNTRVIVFVMNLQLLPGETSSSVLVNLIGSNSQSYDIPAEEVRVVPNSSLTQVIFRLPDSLLPGTCTIKIKAHNESSNVGTIRIN